MLETGYLLLKIGSNGGLITNGNEPPGGGKEFYFSPGIGFVSFEFCPVLSSAEALTLC